MEIPKCYVCGGPIVVWGRLIPGGPFHGRCRNCGMTQCVTMLTDLDDELDDDEIFDRLLEMKAFTD